MLAVEFTAVWHIQLVGVQLYLAPGPGMACSPNTACIAETTLLIFKLAVFVSQYTWKLLLLSCYGKLLWLPRPGVCSPP